MIPFVRWAAIAFVASVACGAKYGDDYAVHIDSTFTSSEQADIVAGLREWETKTSAVDFVGVHWASVGVVDRARAWSASGDADELFIVASDGPACPHRHRINRPSVVAIEYSDGPFIECFDMAWFRSQKTDYLPRSIMHETGHALGLRFGGDVHEHANVPSVMHPNVQDDAEYVTCTDVAAFCAASGDCLLTREDCT